MSGADEIELKLEVDPGCLAVIAALPELDGVKPVTRRQSAIYFDTEDQDLRRAGLSLRIRRTGNKRVQTIKAESAAATGLFARHEWECAVAGDHPELNEGDHALASFLAKGTLGALGPAFTAKVSRTRWEVTFAGSRIEMVYDEGEITGAGRTAPVSEIELELIEGEPATLFGLARLLAARVPVRLGVLTKSDRGYRLLDGDADRAVRAVPLSLAGDMTAAQAFRAIVRACLHQYRLNETILLATRDGRALHQARVALRRLRSALSMFRPMIGDDRFEEFRAGLRTLAGQLGEARNLDVLIERTGGARPAQMLSAAREETYDMVCATLDTVETRALILGLAEWITAGAWLRDEATAELRDRPAERFARDLLDRFRRRVKRGGRKLAKIDDEARHEVRIDAKKLRYAVEFFVDLYPGKPARRRRKALLTALETLQSRLGELNDQATGVELLERLGITDPETLALVDEHVDRPRALADAAEAYEAMIDVKRFWR